MTAIFSNTETEFKIRKHPLFVCKELDSKKDIHHRVTDSLHQFRSK